METISQIHNIHYVHITATCFSYRNAAIIGLYRIIKRKFIYIKLQARSQCYIRSYLCRNICFISIGKDNSSSTYVVIKLS